jgi:predicted secreted protein
MSVLNGTLFTIKHGAGPTAIPLQVDCSISLAQATREVLTKDSTSGARTVLAGTKSASASFSGLVDLTDNDLTELTGYMTDGTTVSFEMGASGGGTIEATFTATGILTALDISGGTEDNVQLSGSFELNWPTFSFVES